MYVFRSNVVSALLAAACLFRSQCTLASTLYEDQRGSTSWVKEFLGDVKSAALPEDKEYSLIHSSDALAAINLSNGTLRWRRQVHVDRLHAYDSQDRVVTVAGSEIQGWLQRSGQRLWGTGTQLDDLVKATCPIHDALVFVQSGNASCIDVLTGGLRWTTPVGVDSAHPVFCAAFGGTVVLAVLMREAQAVLLVRLNSQNGSIGIPTRLAVHMPLSSHAFLLNESLMMISADSQHLCSVQLEHSTSLCIPLPLKPLGNPAIYATDTAAIMNIPAASETRSFMISPRHAREFLPLPRPVLAVSPSFRFHETSAILTLLHVDSSHQLHLSIINALSGEDMWRSIVPGYPALHVDGVISQPVKVWASSLKDLDTQIQFMLKAEDMSLWYHSGGEWCWGRDEALAEIVEMTLLDVAHEDNHRTAPLNTYVSSTIQTHGNGQVMGQAENGNVIVESTILSLKNQLKKHFLTGNTVQDKVKVLVVACRNGLFYALHAKTGRRIWVRRVQRGMGLVAMDVYPCFNSTNLAFQVLVVLSSNSESVAVLLNGSTGVLDHAFKMQQPITHVHSLKRGKYDELGYLMIGVSAPFPKSLTVHMFPRHAELSPAQRTTIWVSDKDSGQVIGYTVMVKEIGSVGDAVAEHSWTFSMRSRLLEALPVTQSAQPSHHVKVHGDRSMSFRYLSPNMAMLVSETETDYPSPGLTIVILDTVSGHVLHSQYHPSASGPVAAAFHDNVAMLHFRDTRTSRWQMTVMELYDASSPGPSTWELFCGAVSGHVRGPGTATATDPVLLKVTRASAFTRVGVRVIHPIQTRYGITPKHLLLATSMNQIYNLDTNVLDPDRLRLSHALSRQQDQDKMARTLQIALSPMWFATYDKIVASLRAIRTAPSQLESTVHLMAWGSDVYFATLRPSHGFDTLGEDFSFMLLLFALAGMSVVVIAMSHAVQTVRIRTRWD